MQTRNQRRLENTSDSCKTKISLRKKVCTEKIQRRERTTLQRPLKTTKNTAKKSKPTRRSTRIFVKTHGPIKVKRPAEDLLLKLEERQPDVIDKILCKLPDIAKLRVACLSKNHRSMMFATSHYACGSTRSTRITIGQMQKSKTLPIEAYKYADRRELLDILFNSDNDLVENSSPYYLDVLAQKFKEEPRRHLIAAGIISANGPQARTSKDFKFSEQITKVYPSGIIKPVTTRFTRKQRQTYDTKLKDLIVSARILGSVLTNDDTEISSKKLINAGMLPILVDSLHSASIEWSSKMRIEAAWALTNITVSAGEITQQVEQTGNAVNHLLDLIRGTNDVECEHALGALGNIIGDGPYLRDLLINEYHVLDPLIKLAKRPGVKAVLLRQVVWCLLNACRKKDAHPPMPMHAAVKLLPIFKEFLTDPAFLNAKVIEDTLYALHNVTRSGNEFITHVINLGIVKEIIPLLRSTVADDLFPNLENADICANCSKPCPPHVTRLPMHPKPVDPSTASDKIRKAAVSALGNILTSSDEQAQQPIDDGILPMFHDLIESADLNLVKESLLILSNVTAGSKTQIQAVIDEGLLEKVWPKLSHSQSFVREEASWVVGNLIVCGDVEHSVAVIRLGLFQAFVNVLNDELFSMKSTDAMSKIPVFDGIRHVYRIFRSHWSPTPPGQNADGAGDEEQVIVPVGVSIPSEFTIEKWNEDTGPQYKLGVQHLEYAVSATFLKHILRTMEPYRLNPRVSIRETVAEIIDVIHNQYGVTL